MSEYAELVKELERGPFLDLRCTEAMSKSAAAITTLEAQVKKLREALELIAEYDVPRDRADIYRDDGRPSKHDRCEHGAWFYDECADCMAKCARAALAAQAKGNECARERDCVEKS